MPVAPARVTSACRRTVPSLRSAGQAFHGAAAAQRRATMSAAAAAGAGAGGAAGAILTDTASIRKVRSAGGCCAPACRQAQRPPAARPLAAPASGGAAVARRSAARRSRPRARAQLALAAKRVAVLGIKTEAKAEQPAYHVPECAARGARAGARRRLLHAARRRARAARARAAQQRARRAGQAARGRGHQQSAPCAPLPPPPPTRAPRARRYLAAAGVDIIPVPVYFPEATEILGRKVYRRVADIPGARARGPRPSGQPELPPTHPRPPRRAAAPGVWPPAARRAASRAGPGGLGWGARLRPCMRARRPPHPTPRPTRPPPPHPHTPLGPPVDIVDVFRRPQDLAGHLSDILAARPKAVWLQSGISEPAASRRRWRRRASRSWPTGACPWSTAAVRARL